jgi:hypothetical protein
MSNWIRAAEAALEGRPSEGIAVDVVPGNAPALLDASGVRALVSPFLAGFMWAAAVFRETQAHQTLDPLALLFRVLALALSLRALRLLIQLSGRLRVWLARASKRYALALTPEGLLFRSPRGDVVVSRAEILDLREHSGDWGGKSGRRWADVYVITHPDSGRLFVALPPVFERTPGVLAETLMRWRGALEPPPEAARAAETPESLASKLWERVAQGERIPGVAGIHHGSAWLQRGPYASILLGIAVLDGFLRLPASARIQVSLGPALLLAAVLVVVPVGWIVFTRASLAARQGLALVLTPAELLVRTRAGVQRVAWSSVTRTEVQSRTTWSILQGAHETRQLVVHRKGEPSIQCGEAFLNVPAEVVAGLCDAYRKGSMRG